MKKIIFENKKTFKNKILFSVFKCTTVKTLDNIKINQTFHNNSIFFPFKIPFSIYCVYKNN